MSAPTPKENPGTGPGLPEQLGDAFGTPDCATSASGCQLPGRDPYYDIAYRLGYINAILDRLEAHYGIGQGGASC